MEEHSLAVFVFLERLTKSEQENKKYNFLSPIL